MRGMQAAQTYVPVGRMGLPLIGIGSKPCLCQPTGIPVGGHQGPDAGWVKLV